MSNVLIRAELEQRLREWATAQSIPVAWQNVVFQKPADFSPYVEPFLIPNVTLNKPVNGKRATYLGLFQINIWTQKGGGIVVSNTLAQSLIDAFPMLPKVGAVSIESTPYVKPSLPSGDGWEIEPVIVNYRYEAIL